MDDPKKATNESTCQASCRSNVYTGEHLIITKTDCHSRRPKALYGYLWQHLGKAALKYHIQTAQILFILHMDCNGRCGWLRLKDSQVTKRLWPGTPQCLVLVIPDVWFLPYMAADCRN
jgi:hypothetical protein